MRVVFFLCFFFLSFTSLSMADASNETKTNVISEFSIGSDRGKKARKAKRKNRRRKRRCKQFGRKVYAG